MAGSSKSSRLRTRAWRRRGAELGRPEPVHVARALLDAVAEAPPEVLAAPGAVEILNGMFDRLHALGFHPEQTRYVLLTARRRARRTSATNSDHGLPANPT
jgi:hypothetical protein